MAVKSILDIDVNDEKFKRFAEQFQKYRAALDAMPQKWKKNNKGIMGSRDAAAGMAAYETTFSEQLNKNTKTLEQHDSLWKKIQTHTHNIKNDILSISKWIIGGALGLGIAGLFGLTEMARRVGEQRATALQTGTNIGETQAFTQNLGRNLPGQGRQFLGASFLAQTPGTQEFALAKILGVDTRLAPLQFAEKLFQAIQHLAKTTPEGVGNLMSMFPMLGAFGINANALEAMRNMSTGETTKEINDTNLAAAAFFKKQSQGQAFQDFLSGIQRTFGAVWNQFELALIHLLPSIQNLVRVLGGDVIKFLDSPASKKMIDSLAKGIQDLANYIGSGKFQKAFGDFLSELEDAAEQIGTFFGGVKTEKHVITEVLTHPLQAISDFQAWAGPTGPEAAAIKAGDQKTTDMVLARMAAFRETHATPGGLLKTSIPALPPLHVSHLLQIHVEPGSTIIADLNTLAPLPQWAGA